MAKPIYVHEEYTHDLNSPDQIVPFLIDLFNPKSVADVGCGIGTFLYCFKQRQVNDVLGIDGSWADKELVKKYLGAGEFLEHNLSSDFDVKRKFDMALCLEVGEHVSIDEAPVLVRNLVKLSKIIIFSAAIPNQGGQNHINEQWTEFWQKQFAVHGYYFLDVLRPYFWDNPKIHWWYRQNMFVVVHESIKSSGIAVPEPPGRILNLVHPDLLLTKQQEIDAITSGKRTLVTYLKYIYKKFFR